MCANLTSAVVIVNSQRRVIKCRSEPMIFNLFKNRCVPPCKNRRKNLSLTALVWGWGVSAVLAAESPPVYRCPGNPVLYTNSVREANVKDCKLLEGSSITVIQSNKPRSLGGGNAGTSQASGASPASGRIDPTEQRARDSDARRILETELKREEDRLASLKTEYNNGEPERLGSERSGQKYADRVAEMKAALSRKESDVEALRRELSKMRP
jgi:hypothetical protein